MSLERPRLHCHSAFRHYQMFHREHDSSYGNSVFSTTYNITGGQICGGGFFGGLWGGICMGLGAGIMSFLGRTFGGFSFGNFGGFGGFGGGFGGMMASPFSLMGNSALFNPTNFWNIGNRNNSDGAGGKDNETKTITEKNKDTAIIANYTKQVAKLEENKEPQNIDKQNLINLYNKIKKSSDEQDNIEEDSDKKLYNDLLRRIKTLAEKVNLVEKDGRLVEKTQTQNPTNNPSQRSDAVTSAATQAPALTNNRVVKSNDNGKLSDDDLTKLSVENQNDLIQIKNNINNITPKIAKTILGDRYNAKSNTVKVPRNYVELLLAQKTGFDIQFCKNTEQEGKEKKSPTIKGKIEGNIRKQEDKEIYTFTVKDKGKFTLEISFEEGNKTITVTKAEKPEIEYKENGKTKHAELKYQLEDITYNIGDEWATRTGDSAFFN